MKFSARLSGIKVPPNMARRSLPSIEVLSDESASGMPASGMPRSASGGMIFNAGSTTAGSTTAAHHSNTVTGTTKGSRVLASRSSSMPNTIEVVVVDSTPTCNTEINVSQSSTQSGTSVPQSTEEVANTSTNTTKPEYKLSEIVIREKDQLFQGSSGVELEPPRADMYSVRRRSRQFFTLTEEEENKSEAVVFDMNEKQEDEEMYMQPVFNLGESLRRLYFPNEFRQKKPKRPTKTGRKGHEGENASEIKLDSEYTDPVGCASLYQKMSTMYSVRRVQSQPELEDLQNQANMTDTTIVFSTFGNSKSLPNTPKVSPKLLRKNKNQTTDDIVDIKSLPDPSGPGFSFLARVAGDVRMYKAKQERSRQEEEKRRLEKNAVCHITEGQVIQKTSHTQMTTAHSGMDTTTTQMNKNVLETTDLMRPRAFSNESDSDSEKPAFVKNIMNWGMKKKINVSGKDSNIWSPTSF